MAQEATAWKNGTGKRWNRLKWGKRKTGKKGILAPQ